MLIHFPADFGKNGSKKDGESGVRVDLFPVGSSMAWHLGVVARSAKLSGRHWKLGPRVARLGGKKLVFFGSNEWEESWFLENTKVL